jgi:hypothetical protein
MAPDVINSPYRTVWGYIDRRDKTKAFYPYYPWVAKQKYFTDYVGGKRLNYSSNAAYQVTNPGTGEKFIKYRLTRDTEYYAANGTSLGTLRQGTHVGLMRSVTGDKLYDCIWMYTYQLNDKWLKPKDGYWLKIDFSHGTSVANRNIQ